MRLRQIGQNMQPGFGEQRNDDTHAALSVQSFD
jgi:hypothetical protein